MKKRFLLFITALLSYTAAFSQTDFEVKQASLKVKGLIYNKEKALILEGKTSGLAIGYQWGELKTYYKTTFYKVDFGFLRHSKETRVNPNGSSLPASNAYYYGKRNSFWQVHGTWGEKRYLSDKDGSKGVAVGYSYSFGPTLGFLKPYYLSKALVENGLNSPKSYIKYTDETAKAFLSTSGIGGAAPFFTGIDETKITAGGHINVGLHFDWGAYEDFVRSVEVGVAADIFPKKVPIMVENQANRMQFINLYAHLQFGRRK